MQTENQIIEAMAKYLQSQGYRIDQKLTTSQRGIDLIATHIKAGKRLILEAKGGTSSKKGSNRFGLPFSTGQAKSHVSVAFLCAARLLQKQVEGVEVALAFPDDKNHRRYVGEVSWALDKLSITVSFVDGAGAVQIT